MSTYFNFNAEISSDDRLLLRKFIKDDQPDIITLFERYKKDRNHPTLQLSLRKTLQLIKSELKKN